MEIWSCSQLKDVREYLIFDSIHLYQIQIYKYQISIYKYQTLHYWRQLSVQAYSSHRLDSDSLDLSGSLFVGGVDYLDPALSPPPQIWSTSLKRGFVGCLKDLIINGADIDIVAYAHEQNSGVCADKF